MIAQIERRFRDFQVLLKVNDLLRALHRSRPDLPLTLSLLPHFIQLRTEGGLSRLQEQRFEEGWRRDDRQRGDESRHFQIHLHRLSQNHPHARQQHGDEQPSLARSVAARAALSIALQDGELVLDVAVNQRSAERRAFGQEAIDLRQRRVELLREAREQRGRRRGKRRGGWERREEGSEDDGVLRAEESVEELHGGDGDGGGVAVDAVEKRGEEELLVAGLAAEEANEELDEGRGGGGEEQGEEKAGDAGAGDDSLVAGSEAAIESKPNVQQLDFDVSVQHTAQYGVENRRIEHQSLLWIVLAVHRAATETQQLGDKLQSVLQHVFGRLHLRSHCVHRVELQNRIEEILSEQPHHLRVVCEVERDLRIGKSGEEKNELPGSAANRGAFVSKWSERSKEESTGEELADLRG